MEAEQLIGEGRLVEGHILSVEARSWKIQIHRSSQSSPKIHQKPTEL